MQGQWSRENGNATILLKKDITVDWLLGYGCKSLISIKFILAQHMPRDDLWWKR